MGKNIITSIVIVSVVVTSFLFFKNAMFLFSLGRDNSTVETILISENTKDNTESYKAEVFLSNKDRKLIFNYTKAKAHQVSFTFENGNALMMHDKTGIKKIMELHKLAPYTVEDGIKVITGINNNELLAKECTIKKTQDNYWIVSSSEENQIDCGEYAQPYDDSETRYFIVISNYYLAFIDKPNNNIINIEEIKIYTLK